MKKRRPFELTKPCANCPFRTDVPAYLRGDRIRQIRDDLEETTFNCHKTVQHTDEDEESGHYVLKGSESHCAGALILLEKLNKPSQMMRIAERLRLYDRTKLDMLAPVYDSFEEMIAAQPDQRPRGRKTVKP
jgi:hypothetical protein